MEEVCQVACPCIHKWTCLVFEVYNADEGTLLDGILTTSPTQAANEISRIREYIGGAGTQTTKGGKGGGAEDCPLALFHVPPRCARRAPSGPCRTLAVKREVSRGTLSQPSSLLSPSLAMLATRAQ